MQFKEWITKNRLSLTRLSDLFGLSQSYIWRLASGQRMPRLEQMARIYVESGTAVSLDDWIELHRAELERDGVIPEGWRNPHG